MCRPLTRRDAAEREQGIAIVAALWAAALLAIVILSVLQIVRADARLGRGREDVAQMNAVADAAVNITILALMGPRASQPAVNGVPFTIAFDGREARVTVQDEAGKIDLNMARDVTLVQMLLDAGLDTNAATALAARMVAWRGTKTAAQDADSAGHRQPFQSVQELQLVPGMTPDLYQSIAPMVTVYSQTASVDPAYSTLRIMNIFRAIDRNAESAWRRMEEVRTGLRPPDPSPGVAVGHAFTITAAVSGPDGARATRMATIRLTGQARQPFLIYRWN
jgi:general secretion pathway protein K